MLKGLLYHFSPGQNTGIGSLSLLQGIFPTQGLNTGLLHSRWILYHLSHQGSPEMANHSSILAWTIPGTEEPGELQYMGLQELDRHNLATKPPIKKSGF